MSDSRRLPRQARLRSGQQQALTNGY